MNQIKPTAFWDKIVKSFKNYVDRELLYKILKYDNCNI